MKTARLIWDAPATGPRNMAVDQALLSQTEDTSQVTLRFYRWSRPTLSLGYFQKLDDRKKHVSSLGCDVVRRASGGGAILHDNELTYSLCVPSSHRWSSRNTELYVLVHNKIIQIVNRTVNQLQLFRNVANESPAVTYDNKSFLCFRRRTEGDIVLGKHKICGSAQRRLKNSLIQHGSLLGCRSKYAPELPGLKDLTNMEFDWEFAQTLARLVGEELELEFIETQMSESELNSANNFEVNQFGHQSWTSRR